MNFICKENKKGLTLPAGYHSLVVVMKPNSFDDIELDDLRTGKREVFESIYTSYYKELYRFAYHYTMCEEAEDIVQDIFIKLYENRKSLPKDLNIRSYLYGATKNSCLNFLRHLNIVDKSEEKVIEAMLNCAETSDREDLEQLQRKIARCMANLSVQQRQILQLKAEGNNYNQIAKILNISPGTVNTHIIRAYKSFRDHFIYLFFIFVYMFFLFRVF